MELKSLLCDAWYGGARKAHVDANQRLWDDIPGLFGFQSWAASIKWPELSRDSEQALEIITMYINRCYSCDPLKSCITAYVFVFCPDLKASARPLTGTPFKHLSPQVTHKRPQPSIVHFADGPRHEAQYCTCERSGIEPHHNRPSPSTGTMCYDSVHRGNLVSRADGGSDIII